MNTLEYYNRQNARWDDKEIEDIKFEYETKEMTISQIGDIHRRSPGSIAHKIKNIGLIANFNLARGYLEYKNSSLYKEIVEKGKLSDNIKKLNREAKTNNTNDIKDNKSINEITELRNEIGTIKKDVKEILRLMNALYDFETQ
jgi:hypothetical protein